MPLVNNFLGCFELETGGVIISWLGMIGLAMTILAAGSYIINNAQNCEYNGNCSENWIVGAIVILVLLLFFFIYALLYSGIRNRKHSRVFPALVISCIGAVLSVLGLFVAISKSQTQGIGGTILYAVIQIYFYIVLRELYLRFKSEKNNPRTNYAA